MSENGINYYMVPTGDCHGSEYICEYFKDREYMTGFTGSAGTLLVSKSEAALFVDGRYHIQAENETKGTCINVYKLGVKDVPDLYEYLKKHVKQNDVIGFNGRVVMQEQFDKLKKLVNVSFEIEKDLVRSIRDDGLSIKFNPVLFFNENECTRTIEEKLADIRNVLKKEKADAFFISALDDVCYTFNIRGRDIEYSTVCFSYAYITNDSATLYIEKSSLSEESKKEINQASVNLADYSDIETELFKIKGKTVLIDFAYTSAYFAKIIGLGNKIKKVNSHKAIKKHIKSAKEQELMRKFAIDDSVCVIEFIARLKEEIKAGIQYSEYDAVMLLDSMRKEIKGFFGLSFETICAYKDNAAIVHYTPDKLNSRMLKPEGLLLVDSGAHYIGATTDITRTFALGNVSDEEKRAFTLVLKGNLNLMNAKFLKGTRCESLDVLARMPLWQNKMDYMHSTGHGIGAFLNVHEGPYRITYKINNKNPQPDIKPGAVISDEPGYYETGAFGIRHETQLLCVKDSENEYGEFCCFEPLTLVPFDSEAIDASMFNNEESEILKHYNELIVKLVYDRLSERAKKWVDSTINSVD